MNVNLYTNGTPIKTIYSAIREHPELGVEMAYLELKVGNASVNISFETWDEMIDFCDQHNFEYKDKRPKTQQ